MAVTVIVGYSAAKMTMITMVTVAGIVHPANLPSITTVLIRRKRIVVVI